MATIERHVIPLPDVDAVDDIGGVIPWDLDIRLLEGGFAAGSIETISTKRVSLSKFFFPWKLHQSGAPPRGVRTFGIGVLPGQRLPFCGYPLEDDWLVAFPSASGFDAQSDVSFRTYGLTLDEALMEETASALGLPSPADSVPEVGVYGASHIRASGIRESLNRIFRAACRPSRDICEPGLVHALEHDLVAQLLSVLSGVSETRSRPRHRDRALKRCLDFIEQPTRRLINVQDLCELSGASWRTLDYAFKERFGVTPQVYLRARRLNAVRGELRDAKPERGAVARVAGRWEFWHMGDFARAYRRLFGELPSETLGRQPHAPGLELKVATQGRP